MTEPVTPKADRRVLDGEVVNEQESGKAKGPGSKNGSDRKREAPSSDKKPSVWSKPWLRKSALWAGSLAVIVAALYATRPDTDWQVEHINRLQTQVAQLSQGQQKLTERTQALQAQLDEGIASEVSRQLDKKMQQPENQPLVTQQELQNLRDQLAQLKQRGEGLGQEMESRLQGLRETLEERWKALSEQMAQAGKELKPSPEQQSQLKSLEERLRNELGRLGQEMESLLDLQPATPADQPAAPTPTPLNRLQIQQWMVEINTDWLIRGNVGETRQQLLALEQALGLSDLPNKTEIARRIGQDLNQIERLAQARTQARTEALEWVSELRNQAAQLTAPAATEGEKAVPKTQQNEAEAADQSTWARFMDRLSGLVSLQKRPSEESLTQVESLLMEDVLKQRAALLVDRIEWAVQSGSPADLQESVASLQRFIGQHFPNRSAAFADPLKRLSAFNLPTRSALNIVDMPAVVSEQEGKS